MHAYLAQHCFFLLPHVPVGIQNAAAASEKTKDPGLHKGNGSQTLDYGVLPKGVDGCGCYMFLSVLVPFLSPGSQEQLKEIERCGLPFGKNWLSVSSGACGSVTSFPTLLF